MKAAYGSLLFLLAAGLMTFSSPAKVTVRAAGPAHKNTASGGVFFNVAADGLCEYVPFAAKVDDKLTKEMVLEGYRKLVDRYAGTEITHLLLNVNYQRACYPSKVWKSYWDVDDPDGTLTGWPRTMWRIHRKGVDPYAVCIELCRNRGISPWASMRMNDTHYVRDPNRANPFWTEHPEFRSSPSGGFDFAVPAVRTHHLALIGEILERYDVDGLELDWMRFCHHFKPGEAVAGCKILTGFMREVRHLAAKAAGERGHSVQIAARVPAVPEFARGLGLDAAAWVREGLVDVLIVSSTWMPADRDMPLEAWRARIGPVRHAYTLAASMGLWVQCVPGGVAMRNDLETARGFTASMLDRGADQIYLFNHFNFNDFSYTVALPDGTREVRNIFRRLAREAGRPDRVLDKPRRYPLTFHDTAPPGVDNPKPLPARLSTNRTVAFRIHIGPRPSTGRVFLRVGLDDTPAVAEIGLAARVNGAECRPLGDLNRPDQFVPRTRPGPHTVWSLEQVARRIVQFEVPLAAVKRGYNAVEVSHRKGGDSRITWLELYVVP